ncbi:MarC family integral membrane protein [uncultured archaeon]|nr:MarC family integral membrane protein [uncultured archaeon]
MNWLSFAIIAQIFVLVNPISSVPALIRAYSKKFDVKKIALYAVLVAFILAVIINFVGPSLFTLFGITLDSFRIAGGILLLLLGIQTIWVPEKDEEGSKVDSIISIIATPLLTGPATISFITLKSFELGSFILLPNIVMSFVLVGIVFYLFALAVPRVNQKVIDIVSKIFALFLMGMAVELIVAGIKGIFGI